jgi:dTDP-4-dehydrorhamnose reductase
MIIAVIGSTGQLGTDLMKVLRDKHEIRGLTHQDIEVTDYDSCQILKKHQPDVIINTAAFHKTDKCEDEPLKAFAVNSVGAKNVATTSRDIQATTIYVSTDYVFDGRKNEPYTEDDIPNPINTYGVSKLAGELCTKQNPKHYIMRVASLFGVAGASGKGGNFVETMITKAKNNEPISVVEDMWMSPTYTKDAATTIQEIIEKKLPYGTYHATNQGYCTWFQFTKEILRLTGLNSKLTPTKTSQLRTKTQRPSFSALRSTKLSRHSIQMREWKEALADYLAEKGHLHGTLEAHRV